VHVASTPDAFGAAVRHAIPPAPAAEVARRIEVAQSNSWERRLVAMSSLVDRALQDKQAVTARWDERLRRMYAVTRRRTLQSLLGLAAVVLLLFHTPLLWWVAEPLKVVSPPQPADAIVVFAGGVGESGTAGGGVQERVAQALALYEGGYAPRVIFSSGYVFTLREAEVMKAIAVANGVPEDAVLLEEQAANTYDNVRLTYQILEQHGWRRILLVSSPYHMRRALLTWKRVAPDVSVTPTPVPQSQFYLREGGASPAQLQGILHEYVAILYYWWKGWV
jgi:uncharacterized SAM-binding protein YcdF (DUF218 family)